MNIDQLLNPKPGPTVTRPASAQRSNQYLEHGFVSKGSADSSSNIHFLTGTHTDQEKEIVRNEDVFAMGPLITARLMSNVNEASRHPYSVPATYMTHGRQVPPQPGSHVSNNSPTSLTSSVLSTNPDLSSQLLIGDISLHSRASSSTSLSMDRTRKGELRSSRSSVYVLFANTLYSSWIFHG